jgi:hypothetical protein
MSARWAGVAPQLDPDLAARIRQLRAEINDLIEAVIERDPAANSGVPRGLLMQPFLARRGGNCKCATYRAMAKEKANEIPTRT